MPILFTPDNQRKAIKALLETVPGMGVVHDQRRAIRDENAIRQLLVPGESQEGKVNGWMITPGPTGTSSERNPGFIGGGMKGGGEVRTTFNWLIDAYLALDDAADSEKSAFDLVWAAADEFNAYGMIPLPGKPEGTVWLVHQAPADVVQFGYVGLAGVQLCHYGQIRVSFEGRTRQ